MMTTWRSEVPKAANVASPSPCLSSRSSSLTRAMARSMSLQFVQHENSVICAGHGDDCMQTQCGSPASPPPRRWACHSPMRPSARPLILWTSCLHSEAAHQTRINPRTRGEQHDVEGQCNNSCTDQNTNGGRRELFCAGCRSARCWHAASPPPPPCRPAPLSPLLSTACSRTRPHSPVPSRLFE